jgi:mRNA-degrading endonuclease RelE of RelBE toxin-antitoxin system
MSILMESTKPFERDLKKLSLKERNTITKKLNNLARLFVTKKDYVYRKLHQPHLLFGLNSYDSSLYTFEGTYKFRVILSIDEDPIFDQVIFTLFRVVNHDNIERAYTSIAESLYQELRHQATEAARI